MFETQTPPKTPIPRTVWALGFVSLLMDVSSEMVQTLLPLYMVSGLGASALALGFIEGISVSVAVLTKFFAGVLADWMGRNKPMAVLGYGLGALSRLIFPLADTVNQVVLAKTVDRIGKGIRSAPRDALIAGASPPEILGASFGLRKSLDTVGGFLGPLFAVALMIALNGEIVSVFWVATLPAALALLVLILFVSEPRPVPSKRSSLPSLTAIKALPEPFWGVVCVAGVLTLARFSEAFVLLKSLDVGISPTWVPLALVVMHAVYGLTAYPVGRLSDRIGRDGLLIVGLIFLGAAQLTLGLAQTIPVFIAGTVLWGLHMGFSQGLLTAMIAGTAAENNRGTAFGTFNLITGAAVLIGNVVCGWLWHVYGSGIPFLVATVLAGIAIVAVILTKSIRA